MYNDAAIKLNLVFAYLMYLKNIKGQSMKHTKSMFEKGVGFLAAAGLIKSHGINEFIFRHLLCQSFENIGKSILLFNNYEYYINKIPRKRFYGHDLVKLLNTLNDIYPEYTINKSAQDELFILNKFYMDNDLRYYSTIESNEPILKIKSQFLHQELISLITHWSELIE
jgi:hypothetical protein